MKIKPFFYIIYFYCCKSKVKKYFEMIIGEGKVIQKVFFFFFPRTYIYMLINNWVTIIQVFIHSAQKS